MAARSSAAPRRRPTSRARSRPARPRVQQHHLDLVALALVALAVLMAFVAWLRWDGGAAGRALLSGTRWLVGDLYVALPAVLMGAAALIVLRPSLPAGKPLRLGAVLLFLGLALALRDGGAVGDLLEDATSAALGSAGPGIVAIFLLAAAGLLLTGASVAGVLAATSSTVTTTSRRVRETTAEARTAVSRLRPERPPPRPAPRRTPPADDAAREDEGHDEQEDDVAEAGSGSPAEDAGKGPFPAVAWQPAPAGADEDDEAPEPRAPGRDGFWSGAERFPDFFGGEAPAPVLAPPGDEAPFAPEPVDDAAPEHDPEAADAPGAVPASSVPDEEGPRLAEDPDTDEPGVTRATGTPDPSRLTPQGRYRPSVTEDPDFQWLVPDAGMLRRSSAEAGRPDTGAQEKVAAQLVEALGHFGVQATVIGMVSGPHITRYELRLAPGIKVAKVAQLKDDLAYALAASDIRILAPIPGKQAVGVEVPNLRRRIVHLGDVLQDGPPDWSPLTVWLGKDVAGRAIGADLAKMPHLLVAGTTGAGKSGCINAMLSSVLLRATPHEVRMVLVDPKQVELTHYDSIPHLLTPVITSPRKAATALQNLVREMEQRYTYMALARTRNLPEMNRVRESRGEAPLPYVLCVIDELADLMMVAPADVEDSIIRLAQKARAVGIHLVLATQSPRVDVITGMIKANVPSRIAFAVSSQTDSRVILDQNGAETLLGQGDMLFAPVGSSRLQRIQGAYIDEAEIAGLTEVWRRQGEPEFREELLEEVEESVEEAAPGDDGFDPDEDPLLEDAIRLVAEMQTASTSMLQRRLRLGYTRAGRLIDMLERRGVISGYEGSKPRQVLVTEADLPRVLAALAERGSPSPAAVGGGEDADPLPGGDGDGV